MSTVRAELAALLRRASQFNEQHTTPPSLVLWPDPQRLWVDVIPAVQEAAPVLVLGPRTDGSDTGSAQGPAIWLRAVLATWEESPRPTVLSLPDHLDLPSDGTPWIIYLPGVSRSDLEQATASEADLAPLVELQHRSTWFVQGSGRPWTPRALLGTLDGLSLAQDVETTEAVQAALGDLLALPSARLTGRGHLDAAGLHSLLHPDPTRQVLAWLNDAAAHKMSLGANWGGFRSLCKGTFGFDPHKDTTIDAARLLGRREGAWAAVWDRFAESPRLYPQIPRELEKATPQADLFAGLDESSDPHPDSWPSRNIDAETEVRQALTALPQMSSLGEAHAAVVALAAAHSPRLGTVWDTLGQASLAHAIGHLAPLVAAASNPVGTSVDELATWFAESAHRADDQGLRAIAAVTTATDREAVLAALSVLYDPWVDQTSLAFQERAVGGYAGETGLTVGSGTCVLFVDALRYDLGARLAERVSSTGRTVTLTHRLAAFPTVTPTGQPAVAPLSEPIGSGTGFAAADGAGHDLKGVYLRKALERADIDFLAWSDVQFLYSAEMESTKGRAWTQTTEIDQYGHTHHHGLAREADKLLERIAEGINSLLTAGWRRVVVVTDHGFLLPARPARKVELPLHLTSDGANRKPRVGRLAPGNTSAHPTLPWTWDSAVSMVSAPGASAFEAGTLYEHGGLSLQECVIPVITISQGSTDSPLESAMASITAVKWTTSQKCRIDVTPPLANLRVELRRFPGDPSSAVVDAKPVREDGEVTFLVDEDVVTVGTAVHVVVMGPGHSVIAQQETTVGGTA